MTAGQSIKRFRNKLIGRRLAAVPDALAAVQYELQTIRLVVEETCSRLERGSQQREREIQQLRTEVSQVLEEGRTLRDVTKRQYERQLLIQHAIIGDENSKQRQLRRLRESDDYTKPFDDANPLVSILIPTYQNYVLLAERAIPSLLAQTYENFEVIIVGENAPPETAEVIDDFNDSRLRYHRLNRRGPYPSTDAHQWYVVGAAPLSEAAAQARGLWIVSFSDDDALRPHHLETLLENAREDRFEVSYGKYATHMNDEVIEMGTFPPQPEQFAFNTALYHAGLNIFDMELLSYLFEFPTDMSRLLRMVRAGVRFGMVDEVVLDYYPSMHSHQRKKLEDSSSHYFSHSQDLLFEAFGVQE